LCKSHYINYLNEKKDTPIIFVCSLYEAAITISFELRGDDLLLKRIKAKSNLQIDSQHVAMGTV